MDKQTIDALYSDFERIGARVEWVKNSTAYRVKIGKASQAAFESLVDEWKRKGATLIK